MLGAGRLFLGTFLACVCCLSTITTAAAPPAAADAPPAADSTRVEVPGGGYVEVEGGYGRTSFGPIYESAVAARKAKDYPAALKLLNEALDLRPKSGPAWYHRGLVLRKLRADHDAVGSFDRAIVLGQGELRPDLWRQRAMALHKLGREEEADANYVYAIEKQAEKGRAVTAAMRFNHGLVLDKLGARARAAETVRTGRRVCVCVCVRMTMTVCANVCAGVCRCVCRCLPVCVATLLRAPPRSLLIGLLVNVHCFG